MLFLTVSCFTVFKWIKNQKKRSGSPEHCVFFTHKALLKSVTVQPVKLLTSELHPENH